MIHSIIEDAYGDTPPPPVFGTRLQGTRTALQALFRERRISRQIRNNAFGGPTGVLGGPGEDPEDPGEFLKVVKSFTRILKGSLGVLGGPRGVLGRPWGGPGSVRANEGGLWRAQEPPPNRKK